MPPKKERKTLNTDVISIIVYIVIGVLVYYIVGILIKITYYMFSFPILIPFRETVFINNPIAIILNIVYAILYSIPLLFFVHTIFMIVVIIVFIIYIIWSLLKDVFIIGGIVRSMFPFKEFDEAGIFTLIDNIWMYMTKILPTNVLKAFVLTYAELLLFAKNRIIDFILLANPDANVGGETIDEMIQKLKESSGVEAFTNADTNTKKLTNTFFENTKKSMEDKNIADGYKASVSITPDMEMTDRMYITFNNELKKIQIPFNNLQNTVTNEISTATYNVE
jgi:hypothetical protein